MNFITSWITPKPALSQDRQLFSNQALKAMIIPLFIEQLLQMIVGIADTLMVSYAGEATVSGVSLDTMVYTIFIYLFTAVATGGAVVVSQYLGNRNKEMADLSASQLYRIALFISAACSILMLLFGNGILSVLYPSVEPEVMQACRTYLWIVTLSFPANALYNAGAALYRSMGKTRTTMYVSFSMNLLNVVGNAIGIFVLHAGAAGVAWPTTISWYFAAVVMTGLCLNKNNAVTLRPALTLKNDRSMDLRILRIAVPNACSSWRKYCWEPSLPPSALPRSPQTESVRPSGHWRPACPSPCVRSLLQSSASAWVHRIRKRPTGICASSPG